MRTVVVAGSEIQKEDRELIKTVRQQLNEKDSDASVYILGVSKRESFDKRVKATQMLMELPFIFPQGKMLNEPALLDEYKEVMEAIDTINKIVGKRSKARKKAFAEKRAEKK